MENKADSDLSRFLEDYWSLVVEVWKDGVFGVDIGRILTAIGILLIFLVIRRLFTRLVVARLERWTQRTNTNIDNTFVSAVAGPISFIPLTIGLFIAVEHLDLTGTAEVFAANVVRSAVVFLLFWAFYNLVTPLSTILHRLEKVLTAAMVDWLVKAIKVALVFIGVATTLELWGVEVGPIIAGLGLFGVAVALGAQDLFKNLIAGILIIAEKRFQRGDWVKVDGVVEGTVETINFRSTLVRRFDKAPVYVPNSKLSDNAVINFSGMTHRRIYWTIGVEYRTSIEQLQKIRDEITAFLSADKDFAPASEVATFVRIDSFGPSSIDIMLYCFTRTTNWGEWLAIKERLALKVKEIVEGAGAAFAFPSSSVYLESLPGEVPELFVPPGRAGNDQGTTAKAVAAGSMS